MVRTESALPTRLDAALAEMGPGYREFAPPLSLRRYLQCVWLREARPVDLHSRVVPDGCIDIIWSGEQDLIVAGPATRAIIATSQRGGFVGVRFRPGIAPSFLRVSADALLDRHVSLETIWPVESRDLLDRGGGESVPGGRLHVLQSLVASKLPAPSLSDEVVRAGLDWLRRSATPSVFDLGEALSLSERQVLRHFRASVGYGPKTFHRILRLQQALSLFRNPFPTKRLADIALQSGYADQAHMTREFIQLAGLPPARLARMHDSMTSDLFKTRIA